MPAKCAFPINHCRLLVSDKAFYDYRGDRHTLLCFSNKSSVWKIKKRQVRVSVVHPLLFADKIPHVTRTGLTKSPRPVAV